MIKVESLSKKYGGFAAVDNVSFTARPGRVTGFLGPNGAGKTTTMRIMVGLTPASSGTATVAGRRFADLPNPGLDLVSLTPTEAGRRVRNYSLGMRQRLGIAAALLGEPEVLILDEPANGLDPAGIRWMRDLLRGYADRGGTVLLSSHLLHEIEVIADDLVVIGNGRIVAQGTKSELLAGAGTHAATRHPVALADALTGSGVEFTR